MARGRFLSASISMNERLSLLPNDRHRCAWLYALPHADRDGLLPGDPHELGCLCYSSLLTKYAWTPADVPFAIEALAAAGLWRLGVDANGRRVIEILRFIQHQEGMRYDRERKSLFRMSIKWDTPATAGVSPAVAGSLRKPPAQVQVEVQPEFEGKGESDARARVRASPEPEPSASYEEKSHPRQKLSGMKNLESGLIAPRVKAIWTEVHPRGLRYGFSDFDDRAIGQFSHAIPESDEELREFLRKCIAAGCKTLEQALRKLNDATFITATNSNGKKRSAYEYLAEKEGGKLEF